MTTAFDLLVASPAGAWQLVGRLTLGRQLDDSIARALRFDPWNSGGESFRPVSSTAYGPPPIAGSRCGSVA